MSAHDYCREMVALPGSSLYYSVLFASPELREALIALHAAAEEFRRAADEASDEAVARAKLGFWAEEMQRGRAGEPRHPVTVALAEPLRRAGIDAARFTPVLAALAEHHRRGPYRTFAELESYCQRVADVSGCMAAELCGYRDPATLDASRRLGVGLALTDIARRPLRSGPQRKTDLPVELLDELGVEDTALGATRTSTALEAAIGATAERARESLRRALDEMPACDHAAQAARRALAEITLAQIRAMERGGYAVLERPFSTTPLRKLWIAWKTRPRHDS